MQENKELSGLALMVFEIDGRRFQIQIDYETMQYNWYVRRRGGVAFKKYATINIDYLDGRGFWELENFGVFIFDIDGEFFPFVIEKVKIKIEGKAIKIYYNEIYLSDKIINKDKLKDSDKIKLTDTHYIFWNMGNIRCARMIREK